MKKVLIEKVYELTYANWDELSEERKKEEIESEMNVESNMQWYYDLKLEDFKYHLEHLEKHYDIEFELSVYDRSRAIKNIVFKNDPFEFRVDEIKIDEYHSYYNEDDDDEYQEHKLLKDKVKQLNEKFLPQLHELINDYDELFLDYLGDDYELFIVENFKANDVEFIIDEKTIKNEETVITK
jgi:hypothetical protein